MAMAVKQLAEEDDDPPKGGEFSEAVRSIATPKLVVEHGAYRISAPDSRMSHLQGAMKAAALAVDPDRMYGQYREPVEIPKASAASVKSDDEERTRLDVWLAHACPMDYTAAIKTRNKPDPDKDWEDVDGIRVAAPQRLRKVKRLVKDEDTGKMYPVWETEPDTKLSPDTFIERPAQYIDDWSEIGVKRAKKAYLKRSKASQDKRADLGKSRLEPPRIPQVLVRRPPSIDWFLRNPDGQGLIFDEPYPNGIVEVGANMEHQRRASEYANGVVYAERYDLNEYKETLLNDRTSNIDQHSRTEEVVTGAIENLTATMKQEGSKPQMIARFKPRGEISTAPPFDHNEPEEGLEVVEGEYLAANEPDYSPTNESTQLPAEMDSYITEKVHESFSSLRETGFQVVGSYPEGKEQLYLAGGLYQLDYSDPRTLQLLEILHKKQKEITKLIANKLAYARLSNHDPKGWVDYEVEEYNIEGILDDEQFELEIERIPAEKTMRPEPILHNQCAAYAYREEMRAEQEERDRAAVNRKKFFERSERREKRRLKVARQRAKAVRRQKLRALATYHYKLLYEVRQIQNPMPQSKWSEVEWFNEQKTKFLDSRVEKRLKKMESYTFRTGQAADCRKIRNLLRDGPHSARGWAIAETLQIEKELNPTRIESETPDEVTYTEVQEPKGIELVVKRQARQHLNYDRKMIIEDVVVPGTVKAPADKPKAEKPIRAPSSGTVYSTRGVTRIHGGDYTTRLGALAKDYLAKFGGPQPRRYKTEVKHEPVEETEHRDQQVGPAAYKPAEERRYPSKASRYAERRAQRQRKLAA